MKSFTLTRHDFIATTYHLACMTTIDGHPVCLGVVIYKSKRKASAAGKRWANS